MWIQNISMQRLKDGDHTNPGSNSMLIQIVDPAYGFPKSKFKFKEVRQFEFLDYEENDAPEYDEAKITDKQAEDIIESLKYAYDNGMNVIVHCHMGICRSGAVCEVGVMMGFKDKKFYRNPNILVKTKMMKVLGWTYE
ncbi:hypothetical protein M0R04_04320 [Candidatus Dojkabacteria bacterium]|jgi:predicted protein tyrosine phosphatase|nr:hypothetical protein [Candidatus Dojkabacteria bacterium]